MGHAANYQVSGELASSCVRLMERCMARFERYGRVIAADKQHGLNLHMARRAKNRTLGGRGKDRAKRFWTIHNPMPEAAKDAIVQAYLSGASVKELASANKCSEQTIYNIAAARGAARRKRKAVQA